MLSLTRAVGAISVFVALLAPAAADPGMVETVTVTASGYDRESALDNAAEAAVRTVLERYVVRDLEERDRDLIDQVLDNSDAYVSSMTVTGEKADAEGAVEITADAAVDVAKLVTTLRNLNVGLILPTISEKFVWRVR